MKKTRIFITLFLLLFSSLFSFAQETIEMIDTLRFQADRTLGGEVVINKCTVRIIGEETSHVIFEIEAPAAGNYYMFCWILGFTSGQGGYVAYDILVNNEPVALKAQTGAGNWQSIYLTGEDRDAGTI